jgi:hypothetical protein
MHTQFFVASSSYFSSLLEVSGFQKDWQKRVMSENAEGYWAIFLGNVSATLRMISHE